MREVAARHINALALAGYLLLAVILLGHTWFGGDLGRRLVGGGSDPLGFVWFLAWLPHALVEGHSPFFTTLLMAPQGANLLNSTSISLPSLLLWPVTASVGPTAGYNVLATLAPALSAWAAYFALIRITPRRASAWTGGAVYGFGGYMTGQATAHVNLMIAVLPPIAAILLDDVRRARNPIRTGVLLGVCAAAQVFVNEEILAITAIMAALALLIAAWTWRPQGAVVARYIRALTAAAVVFTVVSGPALLYQLFGPQHVHGTLVKSGRYVNDLAGFVIPSSSQWLSTAGSRRLTAGFSGHDGELGSYLGLPLVVFLGWIGWRIRRRARPLVVLLGCAAVLSMGPHLRVLGHDTGIFLPWIVPNHLPLLENVVPDRFNLFVWFAIAALLVMAIDDLRAQPPLRSRLLGMAACGFALLPIVPTLIPSELVNTPPVVGDAAVMRTIAPSARIALITPAGNGQFAMYAQAKAGFAYGIPDGGVFVPDVGGPSYGMRHGPLLYALALLGGYASTQAGRMRADSLCLGKLDRGEALGRGCRLRYLQALQALHVDVVIVCHVGSRYAVRRYNRFFASLLGSPTESREAEVYVVRP